MSERDIEMFDKLAAASAAGKGLYLRAHEVDDLIDAIAEMDLQRYIDAVLFEKLIEQLSGHEHGLPNEPKRRKFISRNAKASPRRRNDVLMSKPCKPKPRPKK